MAQLGRTACVLLVALLAPAASTIAQEKDPAVRKANHALASQWTPAKIGKLVFDTAVTPHWLEFSDRFWYRYETPAGKKYFIVDPAKRSKTPLFDHTAVAAQITSITRVPVDAQHLAIEKIRFVRKDTALQLEVKVPKDAVVPGLKPPTKKETTEAEREQVGALRAEPEPKDKSVWLEYELATGKLVLLGDFEGPPKKMRWASVSPDDGAVVFARGENLYMMDAANYAKAQKDPADASVVETALTTDAEKAFSYARRLNDQDRRELRKDSKDDKRAPGPRAPAIVVNWSKDSTKFAVVRRDERKVTDLWVINALANPRPTLEAYRYAMPGEKDIAQPVIEIFDVASKARLAVKSERFPDQMLSITSSAVTAVNREKEKTEPQWVGPGSDKLYFTRWSRDLHRTDVAVADTTSGSVTVLVEERLNTYIETKPLRLVGDGPEFVHWSERDGWGHFYLYDGAGTMKKQITSGEFVGLDVVSIDEKTRSMVFVAAGREPNEDPYYAHAYRVNLDGTGLKLLNPGDGSHAVIASDSGRFLVDNSSRVNTAPVSVLYDAMGAKLLDLETTDMSVLMESGYAFPEPFKVKGDDGITDIYGVMYKPYDFDPAKKYPIIAHVYPGPQTESVTKVFSPKHQNNGLAQFGFIVIEVGNRGGNPQRSKWYHNYGYGNLRDYGLADKKAAIEQLARRHSFIDIERVGITGHSGGGFMSTAAMLVYPDFFKVAVAESGNHDNNVYNNTWSEKHHGIKETEKDGKVAFEYTIDKNSDLARNLKGRLLLATGDIDDNVHPANTYRMADALIKANKRFDFFLLPGVRHSFEPVADYFFWVKADYFTRHLLGDASYQTVDIAELNREKEQAGSKRR